MVQVQCLFFEPKNVKIKPNYPCRCRHHGCKDQRTKGIKVKRQSLKIIYTSDFQVITFFVFEITSDCEIAEVFQVAEPSSA